MKKVILRIFLLFFLLFSLSFFSILAYLYLPFGNHIDENKLAKNNYSIIFYDNFNQKINLSHSLVNQKVNVNDLPNYVKNAFIAVEDRRFYKHNGVDYRGILRAFKNNLLSRSFKEGGSTITQQLIKNTHLSSEKTLSRKLKEIKLAILLERKFSKDEILSFYLNGVYFGNGVYGIQSASQKYFGVDACNLTLSQACALAGCVKAPSIYNPNEEKCEARKNLVLKIMREQNYISDSQFENSLREKVVTVKQNEDFYLRGVLSELYEILNISPYESEQIEVFTYLDSHAQTCIQNALTMDNQNAVIMSKNGGIKAYKMPLGNYERAIGSTIKPLLVYAPAIDCGEIHLYTKILDEQTSFGDYAPKNYGDKYYGYVSAKDALSLSLNVPAVKILNAVGSKKARLYVDKLDIHIEEEGLCTALGSYNGGVKLTNLCSSYGVFLNEGYYQKPTFIKKIIKEKNTIYTHETNKIKVFKSGTCELINEALLDCAIQGTAKAIGKRSYQVCAKTGTVGKGEGHSDAYTVCYTSCDVMAIRFNEDEELLTNEITGGFVAKYAGEILNELYKDNGPKNFEKSGEVSWVNCCLPSYEEGKILKANKNQPARYTFECPILTSELNKIKESDFFNPTVSCEIERDDFSIIISIEKKSYVGYELTKSFNGEKQTLIYDGKNEQFIDSNLKDGTYRYTLTPYVIDKMGKKVYSESILLTPIKINGDDLLKEKPWWESD